jgi:predicted GH43/DUF377 family glycosyl hydrolase
MDVQRAPRSGLIAPTIASLVLILGGCGQATAPTTTTTASSAVPGAATPRITATPVPAVTQRFTFAKDAVVDTKLAGTHDLYINPGAVIAEDGVLHMFPNSFSRWPGRVLVPHLTSTDGGLTWAVDKKASAIDSTGFELADPGIDFSTGFVTDDGTWVLIYETVSTSKAWKLARATAPSPDGPWTVEDAPILEAGAAGSFDAGGIRWPWIARIGDRWAMYYVGVDAPENGTGAIGIAFSDDGKTWTKNAAPVLVASEKWEGRTIDRPRVVKTPDGYAMVYVGRILTNRGLATSPDGLAWTKIPGPSIERNDFPVTEPGSWDSALVYEDGNLVYLLEIGGDMTKIYRATLPWP